MNSSSSGTVCAAAVTSRDSSSSSTSDTSGCCRPRSADSRNASDNSSNSGEGRSKVGDNSSSSSRSGASRAKGSESSCSSGGRRDGRPGLGGGCDTCLVIILDLHEDIWRERRFQLHRRLRVCSSSSTASPQRQAAGASLLPIRSSRAAAVAVSATSPQGPHAKLQKEDAQGDHLKQQAGGDKENACPAAATAARRVAADAEASRLEDATAHEEDEEEEKEEADALLCFLDFIKSAVCGFIRALALLTPVLRVAVVGMNGERSCLLHAGRVPGVLLEAAGLGGFFSELMKSVATFLLEGQQPAVCSRPGGGIDSSSSRRRCSREAAEDAAAAKMQQHSDRHVWGAADEASPRRGRRRASSTDAAASASASSSNSSRDGQLRQCKRVKAEPQADCELAGRSSSLREGSAAAHMQQQQLEQQQHGQKQQQHGQKQQQQHGQKQQQPSGARPLFLQQQQQQKPLSEEGGPAAQRRVTRLRGAASDSMLAGALSLGLCYLNRVTLEGVKVPERRVLLLDGSKENAYGSQYMPLMNLAFVAAKANIIIDCCTLGRNPSSIPEQLCDVSRGVHLKFAQAAPPPAAMGSAHLDEGQALLQLLLFWILPSAALRPAIAALSVHHRRSNTAVCFCHHNRVEVCSVCSCCLAIYCSEKDSHTGKERVCCDVCKSRFTRGLLKNKMAGSVDLPNP